MSHIAVTQAAVRNLATALSKVDTSSLKHGDRLALIAESFGWKVDAFMHALKNEAKRGAKNAVPNQEQSRQIGSVDGEAVPLERLGISHIAAWKEVVREPSGLIIVTGPTGAENQSLCDTRRHISCHWVAAFTYLTSTRILHF